jgi:hypothetical protein
MSMLGYPYPARTLAGSTGGAQPRGGDRHERRSRRATCLRSVRDQGRPRSASSLAPVHTRNARKEELRVVPTEPPDAAASVRDSGSAGPDHRGCWSGTISIVSQHSELSVATTSKQAGQPELPASCSSPNSGLDARACVCNSGSVYACVPALLAAMSEPGTRPHLGRAAVRPAAAARGESAAGAWKGKCRDAPRRAVAALVVANLGSGPSLRSRPASATRVPRRPTAGR